MRTYKIPFDLSELPNIAGNSVIDMSDLSFPVPDDRQKYAAFIFLRNINIDAKFDFSRCTYEDKSEFLIMYMTGKINVYIRPLVTTWISIIGIDSNIDPHTENILTNDETRQFCREYKDLVFEVKRLSVSLPMCAITEYRRVTNIDITNDIDVTAYNDINVSNFLGLTLFDEFNNLVLFLDGVAPVFYTKYFNPNGPFYRRIVSLPITKLMIMMFNPDLASNDEFMNTFISRFESSVDPSID